MSNHSAQAAIETRAEGTAPRLIWVAILLLCLIAAGAAIRRILALTLALPQARLPQMVMLDAMFASRKALTLLHIVPALIFVVLLPLWLSRNVSRQQELHACITRALFVLGAVIAVTAALLSTHPVGGMVEASAALFYDGLFAFALLRSWTLLRQRALHLHRVWMLRAFAVVLGIATTRPVMGIFFATERLTHLTPQQFFGPAFWIGFTVTVVAGEFYIRSRARLTQCAQSA